ncbi:hypothetical protein N2152v2_008030 [Parachlorella kessleri]
MPPWFAGMSQFYSLRVVDGDRNWSLVVLKRSSASVWYLPMRHAYKVVVAIGCTTLSWGHFYKKASSHPRALMEEASPQEREMLVAAGALSAFAPAANLVSAATLRRALREARALPAGLSVALAALLEGTAVLEPINQPPESAGGPTSSSCPASEPPPAAPSANHQTASPWGRAPGRGGQLVLDGAATAPRIPPTTARCLDVRSHTQPQAPQPPPLVTSTPLPCPTAPRHGALLPPRTPFHVQPPGPSPPALSLPQGAKLPRTVPNTTFSPCQLKQRYGLEATWPLLLGEDPLFSQLEEFEDWSRQPLRLDRPQSYLACCTETWDKNRQCALLYLGFLKNMVKARHVSLNDYEDLNGFATYIGFLRQKETSQFHLKNHVGTAMKVLLFLSAHGKCACGDAEPLLQWLLNLKAQVSKLVVKPSKDSHTLRAEGRWMEAAELLSFSERVQEDAIMEYDETKADLTRTHKSLKQAARSMADAAILAFSFGYMPPPRCSCLYTTVLPDYDGPCMHRNCRDPDGCPGNRLEMLPSTAAGPRYKVHWAHHKNEERWGKRAISFTLPSEMEPVLDRYLECRALFPHAADHPFLFVTATGVPLTKASWPQRWNQILTDWAAPARFPPQKLRHIFVEERSRPEAAPGPADTGAAMAMGNSGRTWQAKYDISYHGREVQLAVDSMAAWRRSLLSPEPPAKRGRVLYVWKEKKKYYKITWRLPNKAAKDDYQRQHRCQPAIVGLHELLCTFFFGYKADDSLLVLHFVCDDHDCLTARHLRRSDRPPHWDPVNHMLVTDNWPGT